MKLSVKEMAELSGVSVRTLHYYDEIGVLKPAEVNEKGYRYYDDNNIARLQEILFYRELDFSLKDIMDMFSHPGYDRMKSFEKQKELLTMKRDRLNRLISVLDCNLKGGNDMSFKEFDMADIEKAKKEYEEEVKERWGHTDAYKEDAKKTKKYKKDDWNRIQEEGNNIFREFAEIREGDPCGIKAQELTRKWQEHISEHFYKCTKEILRGLGEMYMADERFKKNIDAFGEGTAEFMSKSIEYFTR